MTHGRTYPLAIGRATLGALALAALSLTFAAGTSRADEEEQQPPRKGGFGKAPAGGSTQQIEKELARKLEEIEQLKKRIEEAKRGGGKRGGELRVEIHGANKEEIERATAALKRALPGKDVKVGGGHGVGGWQKAGMHWTHGMRHRDDCAKGAPARSEKTTARSEPKRATSDGRLDSLEKKVGEILKELEALRKDQKGGPSRGPGPRR